MSAIALSMNASTVSLKLTWLPHGEGLSLPAYQSEAAAGFDLFAAVPESKGVQLRAGERQLIPTGFSMELPAGFEAQIRPRSGLAFKHGVTVLNSPGTIDADYRGEVKVLLINLGEEDVLIRRGERIAQMVIAPVTRANIAAVVELSETARGEGGFGSTGR